MIIIHSVIILMYSKYFKLQCIYFLLFLKVSNIYSNNWQTLRARSLTNICLELFTFCQLFFFFYLCTREVRNAKDKHASYLEENILHFSKSSAVSSAVSSAAVRSTSQSMGSAIKFHDRVIYLLGEIPSVFCILDTYGKFKRNAATYITCEV